MKAASVENGANHSTSVIRGSRTARILSWGFLALDMSEGMSGHPRFRGRRQWSSIDSMDIARRRGVASAKRDFLVDGTKALYLLFQHKKTSLHLLCLLFQIDDVICG